MQIPINTPLICPACEQEGKTSSTTWPPLVSAPTLPINIFFDVAGTMHQHNMNVFVNTYTCSNGHTYTQEQVIACPACGKCPVGA